MISFEIPYPHTKQGKTAFCRQYGLNAYYAGKHWAVRRKDADTLHALTLASLTAAHIPHKLLDYPVSITFSWNDGLDIDNHAAIAKAVVDALKGWLLTDDSPKYFTNVHHQFWQGNAIRIDIHPAYPTPVGAGLEPARRSTVPSSHRPNTPPPQKGGPT